MRSNKKINIYQKVTNKLVEVIDNSNELSWVKAWNSKNKSANFQLPYNVSSKKNYRGANLIMTFCSEYSDPRWGTFNQWKKLNCFVKKGMKSTPIIFWSPIKKMVNGKEETFCVARTYAVFNAEQVNGVEELPIETTKITSNISFDEITNNYIKKESIRVLIGGNKAFYSPQKDKICIPTFEDFNNENSFYSTLYHEVAHSTGHKSRLNRPGVVDNCKFGSHSYSKEELIAEFTSAFLMAYTGRSDDLTFMNSAAYLKNWSKKLKDNPTWAVQSAQQAQKAMDYILNE